ncbi:MAG: dipicolinate synthase subunit B [Clostridia bacterium]|nr:dipicolinate synthase subunit B [Clostridia bacterium]
MIGFAFCGSFCTLSRALDAMRGLLTEGYEIQPIFSFCVRETDTRFWAADEFCSTVETLCGRPAVDTITAAEPLGPARPLDALVIAPCTGNTLAKLAHGVTDSPVTMATKAHLRRDRPTLIAPATNDALSANLENLARLLSRKAVYFVPMKQDDPTGKPHSLVADFSLLGEALRAATRGEQLRPLFR